MPARGWDVSENPSKSNPECHNPFSISIKINKLFCAQIEVGIITSFC